MAKKCLITGSCGFIFSNFLLHGLQYTDLDFVSVDKLTYAGRLENISYNANVQNKRHKFYLGDVADYDLMKKIIELEKPDYIVHAAAESHVDNSIKDSNCFIKTNVVGTHSILEACRLTHMPEKILYISTDEVYGSIEEGKFCETTPLAPNSPYSSSKCSGDLLCRAYAITYNMPVVVSRTCNSYGPRQHVEKFIPKIISNVLTNKTIPLYGSGKNIREWIFVKDFVLAVLYLLEHGKIGEIYNVGSGIEKSNLEILEAIFNIMGKGRNLVKNVPDRLAHDQRYALNVDKINHLGWKTKYHFDEALRHTVSWYSGNTWSWKR